MCSSDLDGGNWRFCFDRRIQLFADHRLLPSGGNFYSPKCGRYAKKENDGRVPIWLVHDGNFFLCLRNAAFMEQRVFNADFFERSANNLVWAFARKDHALVLSALWADPLSGCNLSWCRETDDLDAWLCAQLGPS